jgi:soluble P-type ATPase
MIRVEIPGSGELTLEHLVLDFNGTLAVDGVLIAGVGERLHQLSESLRVHVVTADTFGSAREQLSDVPCEITVLGSGRQDRAKAELVEGLGPDGVVAIGNGRNDAEMLERAVLGIAVILGEGAAGASLVAADAICTGIVDALDLLLRDRRLVATLRV